jgi:hypothetical protein
LPTPDRGGDQFSQIICDLALIRGKEAILPMEDHFGKATLGLRYDGQARRHHFEDGQRTDLDMCFGKMETDIGLAQEMRNLKGGDGADETNDLSQAPARDFRFDFKTPLAKACDEDTNVKVSQW